MPDSINAVQQLAELLAVELVNRIPQTIPLSVKLWSAEDIALYMGGKTHPRHVLSRIVTLAKFPKAIRVKHDSGSGHTQPRWKAAEVIEFFESYQEK